MFTLISGQQWKLGLVAQPPLVLLYHHLSSHLLNSYKSKLNLMMMIMMMMMMTMVVMVVMVTVMVMMMVLLYHHLSSHLLNSYKSELLDFIAPTKSIVICRSVPTSLDVLVPSPSFSFLHSFVILLPVFRSEASSVCNLNPLRKCSSCIQSLARCTAMLHLRRR